MVCDVLSMFVTVTMFCNNVLQQCFSINIHSDSDNVSVLCNHMIVTGYVLFGEIACNKFPVLIYL